MRPPGPLYTLYLTLGLTPLFTVFIAVAVSKRLSGGELKFREFVATEGLKADQKVKGRMMGHPWTSKY